MENETSNKNPKASNSTKTSSESLESINQKTIAALFLKFQGRYGNKFTAAYAGVENIAIAEWTDYLRDLPQEAIVNGLRVWDRDWPPSAPEFRRACMNLLDEPQCNEDWERIGSRLGIHPGIGQSWSSYISSVRVALRGAGYAPSSDRLLSHD